MENKIIECPKPKIWFDGEDRVRKIERYCVVNGYTIAFSSISRTRERRAKQEVDRFFESHFDEHHGICCTDEPIEWEKISEEQKNIFGMTREELKNTKLKGIYSQIEFAN